MSIHPTQLERWDRDHFFHPSTHLGQFARGELAQRVVTGGKGVYLHDSNGNRFLDAFAGLYCVNAGYGRPEIVRAIAEQAEALAYYHAYMGHGTEVSIELAKMIIERAPDNMSRVYFGLSGSDANETNIKLVWYYNNILGRPRKKKIVSRWRGYHGSGLISGSLTGLKLFHRKFDLPLAHVLHTEAPYYFRRDNLNLDEEEFTAHCASELRALIEREDPATIAAFVAEPVLGTGGLVPPPAGYWQAIQPILQEYDILLIADEVVTGFGRVGSMFGVDRYGMCPDIITVAKGLTSAYAPLSGSIVSRRVWDVLARGTDSHGPMGHGWTYSAHPLGAAAGVANLRLVDELGLVENARRVGGYLKAQLDNLLAEHPNVGEIRGEGLMLAVELVEDKASRRFFDPARGIGEQVYAALLKRGVISRAMPQGDIVGIAPPLCLQPGEADEIACRLAESVEAVLPAG
ncbi:MAG: aminotransferase class III-fold pyridoxal phosphate-dependent enzyme [Gammaproteobacteria bacterium]|nr:aminotransferase class III-fold pyridoxal phosphate-dependent enzyme [Gammaproteobacteria bacterium]